MSDLVQCYAGYRYAERPRALFWDGHWKEITKILSQTRNPEGIEFRVHTEDDQIFHLIYQEHLDEWLVERHDAGENVDNP